TSIVPVDGFPAVAGGQGDPGERVDRLTYEADGAVAKQHVAAAGVFGVHLVGVAERVVGGVDDDLRVVVGVGAAVDADEAAAGVTLRRPGPPVQARAGDGTGHDAHPGLVAQNRAVFADEDRVGQPVGHRGDARLRVAVERPLDACGL